MKLSCGRETRNLRRGNNQMSHRLILICGFLATMSFWGCHNGNKPDNLIPEDKYLNMYVEFQLLRGYKHLYTDTSLAGEIRQRILAKYGVTLEQFRKSDDYYESQPGQKERLRAALASISTVKDSVWNAYNPVAKDQEKNSPPKGKTEGNSTRADSKH